MYIESCWKLNRFKKGDEYKKDTRRKVRIYNWSSFQKPHFSIIWFYNRNIHIKFKRRNVLKIQKLSNQCRFYFISNFYQMRYFQENFKTLKKQPLLIHNIIYIMSKTNNFVLFACFSYIAHHLALPTFKSKQNLTIRACYRWMLRYVA